MKVFQIEEPDGSTVDPDAPGVAIGVDIGGTEAVVAVAVGGNAVVLADRDGFALDLPVPAASAPATDWQQLFEGARLRAERMLAQPVTHAVVAAAAAPGPELAARLHAASAAAGLVLLRILGHDEIAGGESPPL